MSAESSCARFRGSKTYRSDGYAKLSRRITADLRLTSPSPNGALTNLSSRKGHRVALEPASRSQTTPVQPGARASFRAETSGEQRLRLRSDRWPNAASRSRNSPARPGAQAKFPRGNSGGRGCVTGAAGGPDVRGEISKLVCSARRSSQVSARKLGGLRLASPLPNGVLMLESFRAENRPL